MKIDTRVLLRSEQTGGHVSAIENVVPGRTQGPFLHRHDFDEALALLCGLLSAERR